MVKRIGIVTIQSLNFGNRLQNYALQEVLREEGYDTYTLKRYNEKLTLKRRTLEKIKKFFQYIMRSKIINFDVFNKNIKYSNLKVGVNTYPVEISSQFDYFITGSDQVWNPYFECVGMCDLLKFAKKNQKISYAASFGIDSFPEEKKDSWGKELNTFNSISVREEVGKRIVEYIADKRAEVVLDPTMLLSACRWENVEIKSHYRPNKKYCLVYSLKERNHAFNEKIVELSKEYEILDILQKNKLGISKKIGPGEFIYLVHNAEYILTDSFHATVFSIIFEKSVFTYKREGMDMSSRIKSLADSIGLGKHFDKNDTFYMNPSIDMTIINDKLNGMKEKSIAFLMNALKEAD